MKSAKSNRHSGSSFDTFLEEEGLLAEAEAVAAKRVVTWQLQAAMKDRRLTKQGMARRLGTSRSQVDRLLDPANVGISLETMSKAAHAVGKKVQIEFVDSARHSLPERRPKLRKRA